MKRVLAGLVVVLVLAAGLTWVLTRDDRGVDVAETGPVVLPTPGAVRPGPRWAPRPGGSWQWQLAGTVDQTVDVPVYDIDGFENNAAVVAALHAAGRTVICYVNVGAAEDFRPDDGEFPTSVQGKGNGWAGEHTLDIRRTEILMPIMAARFDMCARKGFDAVEPDLVEDYTEKSGFPLTAADQLRYNRAIAALAHARGLAVGLKNDLGQVPDLVGDFDFAVNEQCFEYDECAELTPFIDADKAVFHVEYNRPTSAFCAETTKLRFATMRKKLDLDASREPCP
jgi:hypothetical protein